MEILKLIEIFEKCIPIYQKAVDENWDYEILQRKNLESGLCFYYCFINADENLNGLFDKGYYRNLSEFRTFLFMPANRLHDQSLSIKMCIKPRLNFLKREVKALKKLHKKGYTHVKS